MMAVRSRLSPAASATRPSAQRNATYSSDTTTTIASVTPSTSQTCAAFASRAKTGLTISPVYELLAVRQKPGGVEQELDGEDDERRRREDLAGGRRHRRHHDQNQRADLDDADGLPPPARHKRTLHPRPDPAGDDEEIPQET